MKQALVTAAIFLTLITVGCGNSGGTLNLTMSEASTAAAAGTGGSGGGSAPKALNSIWSDSGNDIEIDLTQLQMGVNSTATISLIVGSGSCTCQILATGNETSGTVVISNCSGSIAGTQCSSAFQTTGSGTYDINSSSELQLCQNSSSCYDFN